MILKPAEINFAAWARQLKWLRNKKQIEFMSVKDIPNFEQLTDLERLELAEELAASVRNPEVLPAPVAHRLELERRWTEYERNPSASLSQDQFWTKVQSLKTLAAN